LQTETNARGKGNNVLIHKSNMENNKHLAKAINQLSEKLEYTIVVCEFDETGNLSNDRLLNRLYAIRDLLELSTQDIKKTGAM